MTMQTSGSQFVDSPVVFPQAAGPPREHWKTTWRRLSCAGMTPDREHYVIVREVGDREVYIIT